MDRKFIECKIQNFNVTVIKPMRDREKLGGETEGGITLLRCRKENKENVRTAKICQANKVLVKTSCQLQQPRNCKTREFHVHRMCNCTIRP